MFSLLATELEIIGVVIIRIEGYFLHNLQVVHLICSFSVSAN